MADESLREIELNGKQLVFLFMSATVVAVVIFLSGVMVGRGVPRPETVAAQAAADAPVGLVAVAPPTATFSGSEGPVAADEVITYPSYLESGVPPEERLAVEAVVEPEVALPVAAEVLAEEGPAPDAVDEASASGQLGPAAAVVPLQEPPGNGFVVQVAAVSRRPEAEAIAEDLSTKGYPAFVTTPGPGGPPVFRVRVGKYPERREAEFAAGRLEREEQFRPWITR